MGLVIVGVTLRDGVGAGSGEGIVVSDVGGKTPDERRRGGVLVDLGEELSSG